MLWGHGAGRADYDLYVPTLSLFGPGLVFFTVHYLMLRGFYALERTRTVFFIQCGVAATNITAAAGAGPHRRPRAHLAGAGAGLPRVVRRRARSLSFVVLRRQVGGLDGRALVRFLVRVGLAVTIVTATTYLLAVLLHSAVGDQPHWLVSAGLLVLLGGFAGAMYLLAARMLRLREVTAIVETVTGRFRRSTRD